MDTISLRYKRILVTGGNGYLGSCLVTVLCDLGADVSIIDQKMLGRNKEYKVDISNINELRTAIDVIRPQFVFHLAALLDRDRDFTNHEKIVSVNYTGTMNLLLLLQDRQECENFIFTSTSEIYGANQSPSTETMIPQPVSPYSMTKVFAETAIQTFSSIYKLDYTILRLFNFFGPKMPQNFFIPQLIHSLKYETEFQMTEGEQARDFLYIDDIIQAHILAATNVKAKNNIFNVCSGKSITLKEFVIECKEALQSNCDIAFGALPYRESEIWNMVGDNTKIKEMLGFDPRSEIATYIPNL
jgi:UDP-glucose 4-epimerase